MKARYLVLALFVVGSAAFAISMIPGGPGGPGGPSAGPGEGGGGGGGGVSTESEDNGCNAAQLEEGYCIPCIGCGSIPCTSTLPIPEPEATRELSGRDGFENNRFRKHRQGKVNTADGDLLEVQNALGVSTTGVLRSSYSALAVYATRYAADSIQGWNWTHSLQSSIVFDAPGSPSTSAVTWRVHAGASHNFPNSGSYTYAASPTSISTITRHHAGDSSDTFRIQSRDGILQVYYEPDHATTNLRGKLRYIEDIHGNRLTCNYNGSGQLDYVTDASGHYFRYTYLASGDNSGKIDYVRAYKDSSTADAGLIAEIDYSYQDSTPTFHNESGSAGDLVKVEVKTHNTGETGTTFSIVETTHYRYWDGPWNGTTQKGAAHSLKAILKSESYARADAAVTGLPEAEADTSVDDYYTYYFEYDSSGRVSVQQIAAGVGSGVGCCGGGGSGAGMETFNFSYTTQVNTNRNEWATRTKITHNGTARYVETNYLGEPVVDVTFTTDDSNADPVWIHKYERDTSTGQLTKYFDPSCFTDYDVATNALTTNNDGRVFLYSYDSSSKLLASKRVRKYSQSDGDAVYLGLWEYTDVSFGYRTRYVLDKSYIYPTATTTSSDSSRIMTDYDWTMYADTGDLDGDSNTAENTDRPKEIAVTYATVPTGENGPNVAAVKRTYFDDKGRIRWEKDAEGAVTYKSYHALSGQLAYQVVDVNTGASEGSISPGGITLPEQESSVDLWDDWTGAAPANFQTSSGVKREMKMSYDLQGRLRWSSDPHGDKTYFAYLNDEKQTFPKFDSTTDKAKLPITRVLTDEDGRTEQVITIDGDAVTLADPPDGSTSLTDRTKWISWSTTTFNDALQRENTKAYHVIPSSGGGSVSTNYFETSFSYGASSTNKTKYTQVKGPTGGYTKTTVDAGGRRIKVELTTEESGGAPTSWKTISEFFYDQSTPGSGSSRGMLNLLTQSKNYYDASNSNSTSFTHDWRGRQVLVTPPAAPFTLSKFDNLGAVVAVGSYSSAPSSTADPTSTSTNRLSLSETFFDLRRRVYQTKQHEVLSNGTLDASLKSNHYYDRDGRQVATVSPGSGARITKFNGAGEVTEQQTAKSLGSTIYSSGAFDYTNDNPIIELTQITLGSTGRQTVTKRYELLPTAGSTINPSSPSTGTFVSTSWTHYDSAGRSNQSTGLGTQASGGLDGPMNASLGNESYPGTAPTASDTKLVSKTTFSQARVSKVTAPDGKETDYEYDDLGRRTAMVEDAAGGGLQRRTEYEYDGNGNITKLIAKDVGEYDAGSAGLDDQVTQYVYGSTVSPGWVTEIRYPGTNGQASSSSADKVVFTYHYDGTVATRTDQNQNVITYDYDTLRRKVRERVTTLGTGVDGDTRQIVTAYDSHGRVEKLTSRDSSTADAGNVTNEVKSSFNGFGQLIKDEQEYDGAVDGSTPAVEYAYTEDATNNHSRRSKLYYANDRELRYDYGSGGSTDDAFSRVNKMTNTSSKAYVDYSFAGMNSLVDRDHTVTGGESGNDSKLNYDAGAAGQIAGKDLFGRVISQKVTDSGNTLTRDDIQYESNRFGAPKFADNQALITAARSAYYSYDGLNRLSKVENGLLNSGQTGILNEWSTPMETTYTMDILGNMSSIAQKNGGTTATETRTHNSTNELTSRALTAQAAVLWANDDFADNDTLGYDTGDLDNDGNVDDGTWSAASGQLQNDTVVAVTGAPGGNGSVLLIESSQYQTIRVSADITLSGSAHNGGIVFGYKDYQNFWAYIASRSAGRYELYQVVAGSWTLKDGRGTVGSGGGTFSLTADVRSGGVSNTGIVRDSNGTVHPGRVGIWAGSGSAAVKGDNFKVRSLNADLALDGRFADDVGSCSISGGKYVMNSSGDTRQSVLPGVRLGGAYIVQVDQTWRTGLPAGLIVNYQDPESFGVVALEPGALGGQAKVTYAEFKNGEKRASRASGSDFSITDNTAYTMKAVVTESGGLQTLNVYIAGTLRLTTGTIDDSWSAGYVGLWRDKTDDDSPAVTLDQTFDNFKAGTDQNADGDIDDAGDHVFVNFDFAGSWQTLSLSYDDNGNLTADGVYKYRYDAWNRLVATCYPSGDITVAGQRIGQYEYDGKNRRLRRVVTNRGAGAWQADANGEYRYFYDDQWRIVEVRNGSGQVKQQWLFGTQYVDEIVLMDNNGPTDTDDDCDPDTDLLSEIYVAGDQRYFYHQDRNWNVVALSTITDGSSYVNGDIVERYSYTPYGEPTVIAVTAASGGTGNVRGASLAVNVFLHQGLPIDREKASYQNRWREYNSSRYHYHTTDPLGLQPRPLAGFQDGLSRYVPRNGRPLDLQDPSGLAICGGWGQSGAAGPVVDDASPTTGGCSCTFVNRRPCSRTCCRTWPWWARGTYTQDRDMDSTPVVVIITATGAGCGADCAAAPTPPALPAAAPTCP